MTAYDFSDLPLPEVKVKVKGRSITCTCNLTEFRVASSHLHLYSTFSSPASSKYPQMVVDKHGSFEESKGAFLKTKD